MASRHRLKVGGWGDAWFWWCSCGAGGVEQHALSLPRAKELAEAHAWRTEPYSAGTQHGRQ